MAYNYGMKVYFVRHGQSEGNAAGVHQDASTPLSEEGIEQAHIVADRISNISIDTMLASPMTRTQQTAEIIAKQNDLNIVTVDHLREVKRPTEIEGKSVKDPEVKKIKQQIAKQVSNPDWHYSDEENFFDKKKRARHIIDFIESLDAQSILAVTHGETIRFFVFEMILGEAFTPIVYPHIRRQVSTSNTGISVCEKYKEKWVLVSWNDHAHLG